MTRRQVSLGVSHLPWGVGGRAGWPFSEDPPIRLTVGSVGCGTLTEMRWESVTSGRSSARVSKGSGIYRKEESDPAVDLRVEGERLTWLRNQGIPAPQVLECGPDVLVMTEVLGRTAGDPWPVHALPRVVDALARLTHDLHALSVEDCPFDRRLSSVIPEALAADVDLADLDDERQGWDRERLVSELLGQRPDQEDLVVCHGDLCLPNVLLDPVTFRVTGVIDTARLGVADRWMDLAITTRSLTSPRNAQYGHWAADQYLTSYGIEPNPEKINYYRLLDEFF